MAITFYSEGVNIPKFRRREVSRWITDVAASYGREIGEVTYLFCDDEKILEMNNKYLGHDYYTDIITFGQGVDDLLFADIVISLDTVASNAEKYGQRFETELLRVIIHGILHLCGEDDLDDESEAKMRVAENRALSMLSEDQSEMWRK
ncbi:rRNA maturation RNase YbeY [Porphyromonas cangingivalis]|uniref:Endoribonuclease YbeY n=1 Tax=Porphyromonas cangingivalis TaxID=36874 RepID=A0A1T4K3Q7_PORCN|nr:rRNA maturation RNase YbeY [Porphyromonas cangingivalis]KGL49786.1 rRNA maturation factor [Porphyromonas cangingivalis]SJZ36945.1 rRNA maturation RNase YbeY [Porphyromonas cangingivalis]VEJ03410.1 Probable rRNA maturation factor [Porphyromonas cangingivalis]